MKKLVFIFVFLLLMICVAAQNNFKVKNNIIGTDNSIYSIFVGIDEFEESNYNLNFCA